jgi:hypothetical protein
LSTRKTKSAAQKTKYIPVLSCPRSSFDPAFIGRNPEPLTLNTKAIANEPVTQAFCL